MTPIRENPKKKQKKQMKPKVFDEKTRTLVWKDSDGYVFGIVYCSKQYIEYGWFKASPDNIMVLVREGSQGIGRERYPGISREALPELMWSNNLGYYILPYDLSPVSKLLHKLISSPNTMRQLKISISSRILRKSLKKSSILCLNI